MKLPPVWPSHPLYHADPLRLWPARAGRPGINGEISPYYKWVSAGVYPTEHGLPPAAGPVFVSTRLLYDSRTISVRLDTLEPARALLATGARLELMIDATKTPVVFSSKGVKGHCLASAVGHIVEVRLSNARVGDVRLYWRAMRGSHLIERFPAEGELIVDVRGGALDLDNWVV